MIILVLWDQMESGHMIISDYIFCLTFKLRIMYFAICMALLAVYDAGASAQAAAAGEYKKHF